MGADFFNRNRKTIFSALGVMAGLWAVGERKDIIRNTAAALVGAYAAQMFFPSAKAPQPVVENPTPEEEQQAA